MTKLRLVGLAGLMLLMAQPDLMAQRRPGGVIRGGIRGAMVGGLIGGRSGARAGRRVGAVRGGIRRAQYRADRRAMYAESRARARYQSTTVYRNSNRSNFRINAPRIIVYPAR